MHGGEHSEQTDLTVLVQAETSNCPGRHPHEDELDELDELDEDTLLLLLDELSELLELLDDMLDEDELYTIGVNAKNTYASPVVLAEFDRPSAPFAAIMTSGKPSPLKSPHATALPE
mmetsp:Transcript_18423/g.35900  ORF Transcript_18423/g.35900 Transcript_18423/m.35900 type:complete len:117 (+) Transcript_18423:959-1309(+)